MKENMNKGKGSSMFWTGKLLYRYHHTKGEYMYNMCN